MGFIFYRIPDVPSRIWYQVRHLLKHLFYERGHGDYLRSLSMRAPKNRSQHPRLGSPGQSPSSASLPHGASLYLLSESSPVWEAGKGTRRRISGPALSLEQGQEPRPRTPTPAREGGAKLWLQLMPQVPYPQPRYKAVLCGCGRENRQGKVPSAPPLPAAVGCPPPPAPCQRGRGALMAGDWPLHSRGLGYL